jgi:hypothetical protein
VNTPPRRVFLGRDSSWAERVRVYRTADAVEVAYISAFEVTQRRVFFDEMQLVTLHRAPSRQNLWLLSILTALCALGTLLARSVPELSTLFLAAAVLAGAGLAAVAASPSWVVTAFGSRTHARVRLQFRAAKARALYEDLWHRAAEVQRRLAPDASGTPGTQGAPATAEAAVADPFPAPPPSPAPSLPDLP